MSDGCTVRKVYKEAVISYNERMLEKQKDELFEAELYTNAGIKKASIVSGTSSMKKFSLLAFNNSNTYDSTHPVSIEADKALKEFEETLATYKKYIKGKDNILCMVTLKNVLNLLVSNTLIFEMFPLSLSQLVFIYFMIN